MKKGQQLYRNVPIWFVPKPEEYIAPDEKFVQLTDHCIPGLFDYYLVSNYGRVYNKYSASFLSLQVGTDGYYALAVSTVNGPKMMRVNRLVMMAFQPIDNSDQMVVNHLDGNPKNNRLDNLEWTTRSGNLKHAYATGLKRRGQDNPQAIVNDETVKRICELLETDIPLQEIAPLVGNGATNAIVQSIYHGNEWTHISKNYKFRPMRANPRFISAEIHEMCKYMTEHEVDYDNCGIYAAYMLEHFNYFGKVERYIDTYPCIKDLLINSAVRLIRRERYTKISSQYNF